MLVFPNAKINLGLYITEKRDDGYHNLETVFYPLQKMRDVLEVVPARGGETTFNMSGLAVDGNKETNLVWKAWKVLEEQYGERMGAADIYLHKAIPMGAGLGGGSADGAFALRLFNEYYKLGVSNEALAEMALGLGSDCPFFIYNTPQLAGGRGEKLTPIEVNLSKYSIQVVCPGIHVSTREAFGGISPKAAGFDLRKLGDLPIEEWRGKVNNDFEEPVFARHPELREIKERLYNDGAIYASMSGSGSAVYGVFEKGKRARVEGWYFE